MKKKWTSAGECGGPSNTPAQRTDRTGALKVLFDWVGVTFLSEEFSVHAVLEVFNKLLGISFEAWKEGRKNYQGYARSLEYEHIIIYYEGASDQGIHVDITGQGCRFIELIFKKLGVQDFDSETVETRLMNWYVFLSYLDSMPTKFTRIDVAIDDFAETFTVPFIFQKCLRGEIRSKFKSWSPDGYFGMDGKAKDGMTLYFGSDTSRIQVCVYEKAKQLGMVDQKWTRTEIRFRHERANEFIQKFLAQADSDIYVEVGVLAAGILKDYITFIEPNVNDSNKRRWKVSPFWSEFLKGVEPLRLTTALPDRSILKMRTWINKSVSKSIATLFFAYQDINDNWLAEVFQEGKKKLSERELQMIEEFRSMHEKEVAVALDSAIDMTDYHRTKERSENEKRRRSGEIISSAVKVDN